MSKTICKTVISTQISPPISVVHEKKEHEQQENCTVLPVPTSTSNRQDKMSSIDNYLLSPTRIAVNDEQQKIAAKRDLLVQTDQSLTNSVEKSTTKTRPPPVQANLSMIIDIDSLIAYPNHQTRRNLGPIQSRPDLKIQQTTMKCYERHASASIRETAVHCLQEVGLFKRKSWLKQVEISKEMVKQRAKRRIQRADDGKSNSLLAPM